ncbi:MAG TPA: glycosyltransferase family 9 protein [Pyrinomonadaceae bacterium]|nr:glycosyltransferase family 9 protein [Pyrinomonadaceae bacterium]
MTRRNIEWSSVKRVLVVRLRSIGDTVLATPSLIALRKFLPHAEIDILLEDWVAPVLEGFDSVDNVITVGKSARSRLRTSWELRRRDYDVAFNLHGGTTGTFFIYASGARHRVGYTEYQYSFLYNHLLTSAADYWGKRDTHSAEQQLALLGFAGVPVDAEQRTRLAVTNSSLDSLEKKWRTNASNSLNEYGAFALIHPVAAFDTKTWPVQNFARTAEYLASNGIRAVAIATKKESDVLQQLCTASRVPIVTFDDLSLPEIAALASLARLFVGNDSGVAHIAAAVNTPSVVIFGSSNRIHWHPWTNAPYSVVFHELPCQPCPGYECKEFGEPKCILSVKPESVIEAIDRVLKKREEACL